MKLTTKEMYFNKLEDIFKQNKQKYLDILDNEPNYGVRINTLKIKDEKVFDVLKLEKDKVNWAKNGYYIKKDDNISKNPLYEAGAYYIQEPSAMIPASVIDIEEGDLVLDMCAAPGGKTTLIGERLKGTGALVANDISNSRAKILAKNVEKFGITNAVILSDNQEVLEKKFVKFFDKILIDAPCSGEGMFRKEPNVEKYWHDKIDLEYQEIQMSLLSAGAKMLKEGGQIVYSTCTFNEIENEEVILWFLENNKDFELVSLNHEDLGISKGNNISDKFDLSKTGRIYPFEQRGEGHFVAKIQRKGENLKTDLGNNHKKIKNKQFENLVNFFSKNFNGVEIEDFGNYLVKHKDSLFISPIDPECFKGVRVVRSGFHLGDDGKKFQPSSVLARGIEPSDFKGVINLKYDDPLVLKYLKGETIDFDFNYDGTVLICVEELPLGFGIIKNNKIKNKYNKHWIVV